METLPPVVSLMPKSLVPELLLQKLRNAAGSSSASPCSIRRPAPELDNGRGCLDQHHDRQGAWSASGLCNAGGALPANEVGRASVHATAKGVERCEAASLFLHRAS
jgi:hypothetical protein